ncbi:MAG TPA: C4-type zinc ribbon domain-containing protein [Bacteroidales bacterium]|nr:C4-type zinc ribbon domain-containing protein [Bacteroidales bacterium]
MAAKKKTAKAEVEQIEQKESKVQKQTPVANVPIQEDADDTVFSIENKLIALYNLQQIDSQIDRIRIVRGELPLEVEDLEDEVVGLETRISNFKKEVEGMKAKIMEFEQNIQGRKTLVEKYNAQQMNVRNNREFDSLKKEIEFQNLEIQILEKRIKEFNLILAAKKEEISKAKQELDERRGDLDQKKKELKDIVSETEKEEEVLKVQSENNQKVIEERLLNAYARIRKGARNGLAVVMVERDACGGCFSKIPPQRQLDIKMHKKIIVCEYCGRILVDPMIVEAAQNKE